MKLNNSAKFAGAKFMLEHLHFRLDRAAPKFPIQIASTPRLAGVIFEPGRIAERIDLQMKIFRQFRVVHYLGDKSRRGHGPRRFIAMNAGKDADANRVAALGTVENKSGKRILASGNFEGTEEIHLDA